MNKLKSQKQEMIISSLVEGVSIRSTERMTGVDPWPSGQGLFIMAGESISRWPYLR